MRPLLASTVFFLGLCLPACSPELTVEQQVIRVIRDMESRIEAGERRPFMAHVADDFTGQWDTMNKDQLNAFVLFQLHRHERVQAQLLPIRVTPKAAGAAEARFRVLLTGGPGMLPRSGQLYEIVSQWRRRDDDWMLASATWTAVDIEHALDP
jgi:hypothetical protein